MAALWLCVYEYTIPNAMLFLWIEIILFFHGLVYVFIAFLHRITCRMNEE